MAMVLVGEIQGLGEGGSNSISTSSVDIQSCIQGFARRRFGSAVCLSLRSVILGASFAITKDLGFEQFFVSGASCLARLLALRMKL